MSASSSSAVVVEALEPQQHSLLTTDGTSASDSKNSVLLDSKSGLGLFLVLAVATVVVLVAMIEALPISSRPVLVGASSMKVKM